MQEYNLYSETDTRKIIIGKLQRMFSSCQINVLVGSAFSLPQLKTLENIESDLTTAIFKQPTLMAMISRKKENLLKQLPILLI